MPVITLNEEQAKLFHKALGPVEFRDPEGRILATIDPIDVAALVRARRVRDPNAKTYPSAVVQATLRALQEAADQGMGEKELWELYHRLKREAS